MSTKVNVFDYSADVNRALAHGGVFLNTRAEGIDNTMTIGWGGITNIWGKPVFVAMVRFSRYTYELIEKTGVFTVSVPLGTDYSRELAHCGCTSRRDEDKLAALGAGEAECIDCPTVAGCGLQIECRVVYKQAMQDELMLDDTVRRHYPKGDLHVFYYGEILNAYTD